MRLSKFRDKYRISDTPALDAIERCVFASSLSESLDTIINDNFRGAAEFEYNVLTDGSVNICIDYLALAIRKALTEICGRELVKISLTTKRNILEIKVNVQDISLISPKSLNEITKSARSARFEIEYVDNSFTLRAEMTHEFSHSVQSISTNDLTARLRLIIFE